jgi:hypothetical protein
VPPLEIRKRRRISLESQHCEPNDPQVGRYQDQPTAVRERRIPHGSAHIPGEIPISSHLQSNGTLCAVPTPSSWKRGIDAVTRVLPRNVKPGSGNAALVTRLPAISRGKPPSFILVSHSEYVVRQRKKSYLFKSKFAFSIRGYMTFVILCRSLLRLFTARDSFFLIMTTMTTTSFECSHVNSHGKMVVSAYVLVPKYLYSCHTRNNCHRNRTLHFINQSPKGTCAMVSHRVVRHEALLTAEL